ncbi:S-adenosyl-L-methionine-dependent methyltransferase [Blakeslea trispora]|nr:S-adenosyl-L-methionine-dependent methyltransferase [Blakeslea trispora]
MLVFKLCLSSHLFFFVFFFSSMSNHHPHQVAAEGFQAQADFYATSRPSYPKEAIDFISTLPKSNEAYHVLDLGAGTGIMTKLLAEIKNFTVTAVEPVDNMRSKLESLVPQVTSLKGTSWSIPVASSSQDMVVLAQCFHWFDDLKSLTEIHRVLKPQGVLVLIWNMESQERSSWVASIRRLYEVYDGKAPQYRKGTWKKIFETDEAKQLYDLPLQSKQFKNDFAVKRDQIWSRILSKSYIAVLDKEEADRLREQVEDTLDHPDFSLPERHSQEDILYKHDTDLYWCYKRE